MSLCYGLEQDTYFQGGVLGISSDRDDGRIFFDSGNFWVGKFGKYFLGLLVLSRDFFRNY